MPIPHVSTIKLQDLVDEVALIGDLTPVLLQTGGYANKPALLCANHTMDELLSVRFPWKWNRRKIPPFIMTPLQQDYASVNIYDIGWLENGVRIDINNTQIPQPSWRMQAVRDLEIDNSIGGFPGQFCWFYNYLLEFNPWPGPQTKYTNPVGIGINNDNKYTSIQLADGTILTLSQFGTTGLTAPTVPPWPGPGPQPDNYPTGVVIPDGTAAWTVCDPNSQGIRFTPRPPIGGNVWLCRLFAQRKAPPHFTSLSQYIDPVPDEYSKWFHDGFEAYAYNYSSNPSVQAKFDRKHELWIEAASAAARQGDREDESKGFFPDKPIMSPSYVQDQGPYPYRWGWR